jgi:hypothetical protein
MIDNDNFGYASVKMANKFRACSSFVTSCGRDARETQGRDALATNG